MTSTIAADEITARPSLPVLILSIGAFILLTTEFLILGLLPPLARDLGISVSSAGQLVTLFALTVMIAGPFVTAAVSHWERKKLFILILLVFAVCNALSALATDFWTLALARTAAAIALPVFWGTASETAANLAAPGRSAKAVSQVYFGITAALVLGIPLGTLAAEHVGWRGSFWLLAVLSLVVAVLMMAFLPNLPGTPKFKGGSKQLAILKDRKFLSHIVLSTLVFAAMFASYTYLADILEKMIGVPSAQIGWWLMGFGAIGMLGNVASGYLGSRDATKATLILLAVLAVGSLAVLPTTGSVTMVMVPLGIWSIAHTALIPICQIRVMNAGTKAQALAGTINVSAANGGTAMGAALGGATIGAFGLGSTIYLAAGLALLGAMLALALARR